VPGVIASKAKQSHQRLALLLALAAVMVRSKQMLIRESKIDKKTGVS